MLWGSLIKIWNLANHIKKQNKNHQNAESIGEKLKTKGLMFFVSFLSCVLHDFKFWYVNCKAFGTSFLYWVDFKENLQNKYIVLFFVNCWIVFNCLLIYCYWLKWRFRKLTQLPPSFLQTSKYLPLTIQDSAIATVRLQV